MSESVSTAPALKKNHTAPKSPAPNTLKAERDCVGGGESLEQLIQMSLVHSIGFRGQCGRVTYYREERTRLKQKAPSLSCVLVLSPVTELSAVDGRKSFVDALSLPRPMTPI